MKKTKILFLLTFIFTFCFYIDVHADNLENWASMVEAPFRLDMRRCTSSTNCSTSVSTTSARLQGSYNDKFYQATHGYTFNMTTNDNGVFLTEYVGAQAKGFVYSVTNYICSLEDTNNWSPRFIDSYSSSSIANTYGLQSKNNNLYSSVVIVDGVALSGTTPSTLNCYAISNVYVSNVNSTYYGLRYGTTKNATVKNFYFMGLVVEQLGEYTVGVADEIKSYIDSSGLATAGNMEELNTAISELKAEITDLNNSQDETNNLIKDNNTNEATGEAGSFFSGFTTDTFGLTSVITAPLELINSITSNSCSSINLPIPFVNKTLTLPCMNSIYNHHFSSVFTLYQTITFGITAYWVCVRIFNLVKDFKNPDHDEIEVMEL